jgi:hypothetical protein
MVNCCTSAIQVPPIDEQLRLWRNTRLSTLEGTTATLADGTLGYEWNSDLDNGSRPAGQIDLSSTTLDEPQILKDAGSTYGAGTATHSVTMHRAASGALVFDAGSVQWSWGLDGTHDRGASTPDSAMQQATVNLFADMTVQPATLQSGLVAGVASTDTVAPTAAITSPGDGDSVIAGSPTTVTGTASDAGGGRVAGIEVSTDNGVTWHPASGHESWSYTFTPQTTGSLTLLSRATDDSVNTGASSAPVTIQVAPHSCPCSIWDNSATPASVGNNDGQGTIDYGVKFRSDVDGTVTGFRFYKSAGDPGTHTGHLWDTAGSQLASATFTGESGSGWQHVALSAPVSITAGTTYIVSIFSSAGVYPDTGGYFASAGVDNPPLHALQTGVDGPNGVYHEGSADAFPTNSFNASNYWADVIMSNGPDTTAPVITSRSPGSGASGVSLSHAVTATFNEPMDPATISSSTFELRDATNALVPASVTYDASSNTATLTPNAPLSPSASYSAIVKTGVTDAAGNHLAADSAWTFGTAAPPADEGPGGPILVIASSANPFGRYYGEILRAEGLNEFLVKDISTVSATTLASYDVVVLGDMALTGAQVTMLTNWVTAGGKLVAMRPDAQLSGLLGVASTGGTVSNAYMQVDTTKSPGQGITGTTMQFHGTADDYALFGASKLATLYSDASTTTNFPAVTLRAVGSQGGQAAAFTYDLARSVVYTRQGNPAWSGQERDGQAPIRSDDLFFGASATDPQPDWVNLAKVAIPQADEQQRLFANLVLQMESARKPLPRFWYLPRGNKAVVVMTGDDHANGGTAGRFDQQISDSAPGCNVANWQCVRSTSYIYTGTPLTDQQALTYTQQGFEVGLHVSTDCVDWTPASLANAYNTQLADWHAKYSSLTGPVTNRTHCIPESDYSTQPHVELANGIRLDTNYYYWPPSWIQDRPGLFTGSGFPMRFADPDGSLIDVYQAATQMTDESGQSYPLTINTLLDNALGSSGYFGVFTANMHTDSATSSGADAIIASAQARHVPIVSARQMLDWLDGRNASSFSSVSWSGHVLTFGVSSGATANGLQAMLPMTSADGSPLTSITRGATSVPFTTQTIKGVAYAMFDGTSGSYTATYTADTTPPVISGVKAAATTSGDATITWTTDELSTSQVAYGTTASTLNSNQSDPATVTSHVITLHGLTAGTKYFYRVTSGDRAGNRATAPAAPAPPASFTVPSFAATDTTATDFSAGTPGACAVVAHDPGDGEVELAPAVGAEFSGSALPPGWDSTQWDPSGSATVSGGQLTLEAARAGTTATYGPGHSLEFVATFANRPFQHVGFGTDFNNPPWAIFSTGSDGATLKARSHDGTNNIDTDLGSSYLGSPHRFRIDWNASQVVYSIDGTQVASHSLTVAGPMRPLASDPATDGIALSVDWVQMSPFTGSCTFVSQVHDAGAAVVWSSLDPATTTPAGTATQFDTRTSNDTINWSAWSAVVGTAISSPSGRYLQYRASLSTSDASASPLVNSVRVSAAPTTVPDAPTIGSAVRGNASVSVAFTAPADNGGAAITGYSASCTSSDAGVSGSNSGASSPIVVSGLTNTKTYTCTVTAQNAKGSSAPSAQSNAFTPDAIPAPPTIGTATRGNASGTVTFTPPSDVGGSPITSYTATCTATGGATGTNTGSASPLIVSGLTNGKTYTCKVTARNSQGASAPSAASNGFVPATVPGAPTGATVTLSATTASVAFTAPANNGGTAVTGYTASCTSGNGGVTRTGTRATSPISVSALSAGKDYTCTVTATNAVGTGPPSAASNPVTVANVPSAPTNVKATPGPTTTTGPLTVSFTLPVSDGGSPVTGYVAACVSSDGGVAGSGSAASGPITLSGLTAAKTYTCSVKAKNAVGSSLASQPSVATIVGSPAAPTVVKVSPTSTTTPTGSLMVSFTAGANNGSAISNFTAACTSANGGAAGSSSATVSPITVPGLTTAKTYTCTMTATNARGAGPASAPSPPVIVGSPASPVNVTSISGSTTTATGNLSVGFTPSASNGNAITSFTASCSSSDGGAPGSVTGNFSPISVTGLTTGKTYGCTVTARNARGTGPASTPSAPAVVGAPGAPTNVKALPGTSNATTGPLTVSFTPGTNNGSAITSFTAACSSSDGGAAGSVNGTASPLTVPGLTTARTYVCRVTATNMRGAGLASAASALVVVGSPSPPSGVSASKVAAGQLRIAFAAGGNNGSATTSYTATCTSSNGGVTGSQSGASGPLIVSGLTTTKTYTCTVAGTNGRGTGPLSSPSAATIA